MPIRAPALVVCAAVAVLLAWLVHRNQTSRLLAQSPELAIAVAVDHSHAQAHMASADIRSAVRTFASGATIPALGFGAGTAWFAGPKGNAERPENRKLVDAIKTALRLGFTHLDNALVYGTEIDNGVAIKEYLAESGKKREDIFVTTKVWAQEVADIPAALNRSLARLGLDYVDLYLIHAPFFDTVGLAGNVTAASAWKQMEQVKDAGLAKEIGVSNFRIEDFKEIFAAKPKYTPALNQIEYHPYLQQPALHAYHKQHNILTASYGPLIPLVKHQNGPVDPIVSAIATAHSATPAQVLQAWNLAKGNVVITTSSKEDRLKEYLGVGAVVLSEEEVKSIDEAGQKEGYRQFWQGNFPPEKKL
ncbi:hypothetical protein M427DRAFT_154894 [Gonapodya prolifera JEL478]|uniref:NADP-dependent oxidoreductase domain-containing protein n=1 Tax=Gonapodya prolifera (strain JEL478) TaxID=1344416 RepID=A0A139AHC8_GONPJ|nr:hypothetical protein M427DRAFT_154894 [Gonapodya prolifera JEL478]|eukprot:KXS16197.1 hypothetical protein M427DRAFT_154894 [Gonapodya prolifera JEL478]